MDNPLCACCQEEITGDVFTTKDGLSVCSEQCAEQMDDPRTDEEKSEDFSKRQADLLDTLKKLTGGS